MERSKSGWSTKRDEHFMRTPGHWFRKDNNSGSFQIRLVELKILGFDSKYDKKVTELVENYRIRTIA